MVTLPLAGDAADGDGAVNKRRRRRQLPICHDCRLVFIRSVYQVGTVTLKTPVTNTALRYSSWQIQGVAARAAGWITQSRVVTNLGHRYSATRVWPEGGA